MIDNFPVAAVDPIIFQAKDSQFFNNEIGYSFLTKPVKEIKSFIHRKLGMHILVAQQNFHKITLQKKEKGYHHLTLIGGKRVSFETSDHVILNGMHFVGKGCLENSPTIILFSGSGLRFYEYGSQTLGAGIRTFTIKNWLKIGVNVFIFNYRGIDSKPGSATHDGLILDGDAAFQYVHHQLKVPENKIILHGHSLGAGIASEVAAMHCLVNFCSDRSFSSLSNQIKFMFGGGLLGIFVSRLVKCAGWEFDVVENLKKIKGHKWVIYHPCDQVIPFKARLIDMIQTTHKISVITMKLQEFQSKKGLRFEDLSRIKNLRSGDISYANCSTHMRKLRGIEEKNAYREQIKIALKQL